MSETYALRSAAKWWQTSSSSFILIKKGYEGVWVDISTFDMSIDREQAQSYADALNEELES